MRNRHYLKFIILAIMAALLNSAHAFAENFNIPGGDLATALDLYTRQTGVALLVSDDAIRGIRTGGVIGALSADDALTHILSGTGFVMKRRNTGAITVVRAQSSSAKEDASLQIAAAPAASVSGASLETVTVTSSKIGGDVQNIPISITALSQEQLTATQTAGGPDLIKQVPNMTFTKTNFSGYSIQLRGIGTQAISVTTDPAVAVAFNDTPFIRNHFFEQEFYDVSQVEVLRGPQGTLYGRNATAGVVNLISAKPSDQFEAMASADIGNYGNRRLEGMINIPIVDDRADLRIAGEWTKRQGYSFNALDDQRIDGRDLWSSRVTLGYKPFNGLQAYLVWEHFSEDDDRMRTAKQLCKTDPGPSEVGGVPVTNLNDINAYEPSHYLSQGCLPDSLYSNESFQVPNGFSLPYYAPLGNVGAPITAEQAGGFDPYASTTQSRNLRVIETTLDPQYRAKNDTLELNADYTVSPALTFSSQTGFNQDFLWSTEDYNRFDTSPGAFQYRTPNPPGQQGFYNLNGSEAISPDPDGSGHCQGGYAECQGLPLYTACTPLPGAYANTNASDPLAPGSGLSYQCIPDGVFCDPQLGCSDRLVAEDLSDEHAWQLSQEFRLASHFSGPFNFSVGGNYLHYETEENYYVFFNTLTLASYDWASKDKTLSTDQTLPWVPGVSDNANCLVGGLVNVNPFVNHSLGTEGGNNCIYIDPNPLSKLNNKGHNYFLSQNPYALNSYAGFGEAYYDVFPDLKLTTGLRWTEDQKHFTLIPSELVVEGYGYPSTGVVNQQWDQFTGRAAVNWTPKLDFTDQTLIYGTYSHGYKAGGANPPGAILLTWSGAGNRAGTSNPIHPLTFKPEFIDAFELGSKNTLLDGALTFNADVFYYNYENYQISRIVDRTSINDNFDAHVKGAEVESTWEPIPGLRLNFAGGWEDTALAKGSKSVDLIDRADLADNSGWIVVKPFVTQASNCVLPTYVVAEMLRLTALEPETYGDDGINVSCTNAYLAGNDPVTSRTYTPDPTVFVPGVGTIPDGYPGFDPRAGTPGDPYTGQNTFNGHDYGPAPNDGQGFDKNLSGNELPNAPPFTVSFGAQYTMPLSADWAGTLRGDYYWQDYSWARVFNDNPYDRIRGYTNVNLTLIFTNQNGWQVMLYDKNIFNTTAITGDFLNSDDSGLTTNVFLTDPKLIGIRVTKNW
jgi:outer membrane receptor protein involved in Fe transport